MKNHPFSGIIEPWYRKGIGMLKDNFIKVYLWLEHMEQQLDEKSWFTPCPHLAVQMQKTINAQGVVDIYVHIIDVDDAYQGQGIGTRFLTSLRNYVQDFGNGYDRLIVEQCQTQRFAEHLQRLGATLVLNDKKWDAHFDSWKYLRRLAQWQKTMIADEH